MGLKTPLAVKSDHFISTAKSDLGFVCTQRRSMSRIEQALSTEAAFGSIGIHCPRRKWLWCTAGCTGSCSSCFSSQFSPYGLKQLLQPTEKFHQLLEWKWAGAKPVQWCCYWPWRLRRGWGSDRISWCPSLWLQVYLDQDPVIEVLNGGVDSRLVCSCTAFSPAGHTNEPEEGSIVIFAHQRTTTVTLQWSKGGIR